MKPRLSKCIYASMTAGPPLTCKPPLHCLHMFLTLNISQSRKSIHANSTSHLSFEP